MRAGQLAEPAAPSILIVEDDLGDARLAERLLAATWPVPSVRRATSVEEAVLEIGTSAPACVLLDLSLPDADGLESLAHLTEVAPEAPIIVFTGTDDESLGVQAVQEGAQDYLIKGQVDAALLGRVIRYAIERKRAEVKLAHDALHDPLTGLPNRSLLMDHLSMALARSARGSSWIAVMFLDLDHFKLINDSMGHAVGDELLVQVSRRLQEMMRPADTVARMSGDEFVVLCEDVASEAHAGRIADRTVEEIKAPFELEGRSVFVTTSIGMAMAHGGGRADDLLRDADTALYRAKGAGRDRYVAFRDQMRRSAIVQLETERELRTALERQEFCLFYQPIVGLEAGRIVGAEALVRWDHPRRGLVPPAQFLPFAEQTDLIVPLTGWVLEHASMQVSEWRRMLGSESSLAMWVNIPARQLCRPDLEVAVAEALGRSRADPTAILLEITEDGIMSDADAAARALWSLRSLGVKLAVDDFGTGYSSLLHLQQFPLNSVKIDRTFVAGLTRDRECDAIVNAVIGLSHALGLTVVGEGVETESQLQSLRDLGCDYAQGFFFALPGSASQIAEMLVTDATW